MNRARAFLWLVAASAALGVFAGAVAAKPPPPKIELLTATERGALRKEAIKLVVFSRRGSEVKVEASFVVDGFPEDFHFRLGPERRKLNDNGAKVRLPLSARQREVLDFAIKSCRRATVGISATVGKRVGHLNAGLRRPREC